MILGRTVRAARQQQFVPKGIPAEGEVATEPRVLRVGANEPRRERLRRRAVGDSAAIRDLFRSAGLPLVHLVVFARDGDEFVVCRESQRGWFGS